MARKDIYFLLVGNKILESCIMGATCQLESSLRAKCVTFDSVGKLLDRLNKRKTRLNLLVLLMSELGDFAQRLCKEVAKRAQPQKVVLVRSSFSPITESQERRIGNDLKKVGIQPLLAGLNDVCSGKVIDALLNVTN